MTPQSKKRIIVGGSLIVVAGIIGYVLWKRKKAKELENASMPATTNPAIDSTAPNDASDVVKASETKGGSSISAVVKNVSAKNPTTTLSLVQSNLGGSGIKNPDNLSVKFGGKYLAKFYTNSRIIVYSIINSKLQRVVSGTYSNGGKTITTDKGKVIKSNSVWQNLSKTLS